MPLITYLNPTQDSVRVSAYSKKVLEEIMQKSGVPKITVTSTARTASEQARIMYENIERHGLDHQKKLYGPYGDKVIDVYPSLKKQGKTKAEIISGMTAKISSLGPSKVSRHAGDPNKLNVVDIAPSSINLALRKKFENAVKGDSRVSKFLGPPGDPAYHIEIPQP
jgi:hypothetical protein